MFDQSMSMMTLYTKYCLPPHLGDINKNRAHHTRRSNPYLPMVLSSVPAQANESRKVPESKKALPALTKNKCGLPRQENKVGIIGGLSVFPTLIFLEKLVWWSTRNGGECLPFVVCSDPELSRYLQMLDTPSASLGSKNGATPPRIDQGPIVENLKRTRTLLEQSGASSIVMPCQVSHAWYGEVSEGCSLPFLHVGECVARELKEAELKPLEAGSNIRIGILGTRTTLMAGFYQEKLQNQGFEVVVPDSATMDHIVVPAIEAMKRNDKKGARNLLQVALQVLLVRAVSTIILASDEMQGLLPLNDPLLKKCVNPMDALVRSTIKWARSVEVAHQRT